MNLRFAFVAVASMMIAACGGTPQQEPQTEQPATQEQGIIVTPGPIGGGACGSNTCTSKQFCCNPSCGICAPLDGACTQQVCDTATLQAEAAPVVEEPAPESIIIERTCGKNTCGTGEFCCNVSCGICAPKGGSCTQQYCPPEV